MLRAMSQKLLSQPFLRLCEGQRIWRVLGRDVLGRDVLGRGAKTAARLGFALADTNAAKIVEVGPRDGLQNENVAVSTQDKVELITRLADAGCKFIEAGSFVSPKWVPNMADSTEVMEALVNDPRRRRASPSQTSTRDDASLVLSCLVPNLKGMEFAVQAGADEIAIFGSASEAFSQRNINCSIQESLQRFRDVTDEAHKRQILVRGYLSCVIACPYQGPIEPAEVGRVAEKMLDLGCHELSLGDTIGVGTPATTAAMLEAAESAVGGEVGALAVHFHDTYGQALANILVSLERGIFTIDSSVAGLGGCPYAKGASGNVATEDVIYMLNGMGVQTNIDLDKMVDSGEFICSVIQRPTRSKVGAAISAKRKLEAE